MGDAHIFEEEFGSVARPVPDFFEFLRNPVSFDVGGTYNDRDTVVPSIGIGLYHQGDEVSTGSIGDVCLGSVDHIIIAYPSGSGSQSCNV